MGQLFITCEGKVLLPRLRIRFKKNASFTVLPPVKNALPDGEAQNH